MAARGPTVSEAPRTVTDPNSVMSGPPNIARAVRNVDPVES